MTKSVFRIVLLLVVSLAVSAGASLTRKPFVLDTVLVKDGKQNAVIIAPDSDLANKVQAAVKSVSGAELPFAKDSDYAAKMGELRRVPEQNVILIGNQETSWFVTYLVHMSYAQVDTQYPGKGGYVIRSIHDPWGTGVNVILITGSDLKGISAGVSRFCSLIPSSTISSAISRQQSVVSIPRIFDAKFSKEAIKANSKLVTDLTDAEIAKQVKQADDNYHAGIQAGLFNPINYAAGAYNLSGKECYAKLFRELLFKADELAKTVSQGNYGGPYGAAADFLFGPLMTSWDNIEESASLTDEDRARVVRILLDYIRYWEDYGYSKGLDKPMIRQNHYTFEGQGWLVAGQYFGKYYDTPESKKWMQMADWCFGYQMKSFKPQEDCGAYQWIITRHMCRYAISRQDFGWFTSGKSRMSGDLGIMTMDNLGYPVSFGDVAGFAPLSVQAPWTMMISVDRDGRWVWALEKSRKAAGQALLASLAANVKPVEPTDLLGLKCMPTDPLFYEFYKPRETDPVPQEKTFEKISFRKTFSPNDAYMLLDGINYGYHGHWDGNSVLRMTDRNRIWLCDSDYIKSLPKYHNTLLILKNGQSSALPYFCERVTAADLPNAGISSTTTHNYSGTDWTRNVIWDKGHTFVFIDEMQARETADYSFRAYWQTLGKATLDGSLFRVTQKGPVFSIRNMDGSKLRYYDDPVIGQNWKGYKYADPVIRTHQQIRSQKMRAGGRTFIMNVLSTEPDGSAPVETQRAGESSILLGEGDDQALVGVRLTDEEIVPGLKTDAHVYHLSRRSIALGSITRLTIEEQIIFKSDVPVSIELTGKKAIIITDTDANVTLLSEGRPVAINLKSGKAEFTGVSIPSSFRLRLPKPAPVYASGSTVSSQEVSGVPGNFCALATDETGIYAGTTDGKLAALTSDGQSKWTFDAGSEVRAVWVGRLEKDGPVRIAVGTVKSAVYLLDESGKMLWKREIPFFKQASSVVTIFPADLWGDGNLALIVGAESWNYHAFDSDGNQVWAFEILHCATAGTAVDLDGDGNQEVITGSDYYSWRAVKPTGEKLWDYKPIGPRNNSVQGGDLTGTGRPHVIFGGADGNVHAVDAAGKRVWLYNTGDEVTCTALTDVDGDGVRDVVAGSLGFDVVALKGDGTLIWRRDIGEPVANMVLADLNGDGKQEICIGTEDGHVFVLDLTGKVLTSWALSGKVTALSVVPSKPDQLSAVCGDGSYALLKYGK